MSKTPEEIAEEIVESWYTVHGFQIPTITDEAHAMLVSAIGAALSARRDEVKRTSDELFDLRCRCGLGPDQDGPDVFQLIARLTRERDALKSDVALKWQPRQDEIIAERDEAVEALRPFAHFADQYGAWADDSHIACVYVGHLRRARAVLSRQQGAAESDRDEIHG